MGVNKVIYKGRTLIDLTNDTVTPGTLAKGFTAHNARGEEITGTMDGVSSVEGKQVKTGTTTSTIIHTGLSSIDTIVIYSKKIQAVGLVNTVYTGGSYATSVICAEYSVYTKYCGTIESNDFQITGGTFQWNGSSYNGDNFMNGVTYYWIATGN